MTTHWFRYHDDNKNRDYYYNTQTTERQWRFPMDNATVWDAETLQRVRPPKKKGSASSDASYSNNPVFEHFNNLIQKVSDSKLDEQFFDLYLRLPGGKESEFKWSDKPLKDPLVQTIKGKEAKIAIKNFQLVQKLTGVPSAKTVKGDICTLVHTLKESPFLVDEVYMDLWKQTIKAADDKLDMGLKTFLVLATLFVPGKPFRRPLLRHIAKLAKNYDVAKFVFVRLDAICREQKPICDCKDDTSVKAIPSHPQQSKFNFGVSLWEIFNHQRISCGKMPIPMCMYKMLARIQALNGFDHVGIFRLPGNMKRIDDVLIPNANSERELFSEQDDVDTIASLVKRWLRDIPGKIIHEEDVPRLMDVGSVDKAIQFAESLEYPSKNVLMYLIGYLRDCASHENENKMTQKNIAMVFGPNIVAENDSVNAMEVQQKIQFFLQALLEKWDTSSLYPLNPSYLPSL